MSQSRKGGNSEPYGRYERVRLTQSWRECAMNALPLPLKPLDLPELAEFLRSHLKSAMLADAYAEDGRFVLRLSGSNHPCDQEAALAEIHELLNARQIFTCNGAGIEVRFGRGAPTRDEFQSRNATTPWRGSPRARLRVRSLQRNSYRLANCAERSTLPRLYVHGLARRWRDLCTSWRRCC